MRSWFMLLLAGLAESAALLPLTLVVGRLAPVSTAAPFVLLLVWLGAWLVADRAPRWRGPLGLPLLLAGLLLIRAGEWSTLLLDPAGVVVLLVPVVAAWWGGSYIGTQGLNWFSAYHGLRRSVGFCLGGLGVLLVAGAPGPVAVAGPLILFGAGLTLLYLLRLGDLQVTRSGTAIALAPLAMGALLALLVSPGRVAGLLGVMGRLLGAITEIVFLPFGYLAAYLVTILRRVFAHAPERQAPVAEGCVPSPTDLCVPERPPVTVTDMAPLRPYVGGLLLIGLVILLFLLIRRLRQVYDRRDAAEELDEVRTSPGLLRGLLADLRSLFADRIAPQAVVALAPGDPRRLLRRLQAWGAGQGRSRRPAETPAQYAQALCGDLPEGASSAGLDALTAAYSDARYGSGAPKPGQVAGAEVLLLQLEQPPKGS